MTKEYGNYKIQLPDATNHYYFVVIADSLPGGRTKCESYADSIALCDSLNRQDKATKKEKLALSAISEKSGERVVITGIHARHGSTLTTPAVDKFTDGLLPDIPWVIAAVREIRQLVSRANAISAVIRGLRISPATRYESFREANHSAWVANIKKNHALMTKKAEDMGGIGELSDFKSLDL